MPPFITIVKSPRVRTTKGDKIILIKGFTQKFIRVKITAAIAKLVRFSETENPGMNFPAKNSATKLATADETTRIGKENIVLGLYLILLL